MCVSINVVQIVLDNEKKKIKSLKSSLQLLNLTRVVILNVVKFDQCLLYPGFDITEINNNLHVVNFVKTKFKLYFVTLLYIKGF